MILSLLLSLFSLHPAKMFNLSLYNHGACLECVFSLQRAGAVGSAGNSYIITSHNASTINSSHTTTETLSRGQSNRH